MSSLAPEASRSAPSASRDGRRIALVVPDMRGGGAERVALTIATGLARRDHRISLILAHSGGELLGEVPAEIEVVELGCERFRHVPKALAAELRRSRVDALLSFMWPLNIYVLLAARLTRTPARVVVTDHIALSQQYGGWNWRVRAFLKHSIRLLYPRASARVLVSEGAADDLARLSGLPRTALDVIYNPIPAPDPLPSPSAADEALWGGPGPRILTVGSLKEQKNQALLIRALAALPRELGARLMILGEGELRPALEQLAQRLGIADRVLLPGFRSDPWPFYASADLFALASDYEGFANVVAEALKAGLPVVSTDCPSGPAEILGGGRFGRLVPVGDVEAMARALEAALNDRLAPSLSAEWRARFDPERSLSAYERLLVGPPGGPAG